MAGIAAAGAPYWAEPSRHLAGVQEPPAVPRPLPPQAVRTMDGYDLGDVMGQSLPGARWRWQWPAATTSPCVGPPGVGKTLLLAAYRPVPPLDDEEAIEVSRIQSAAGRSIVGRP